MRSNAKLKFKLMLTCLITLTLIFAALMISFTAGKTTKNALAADDIWMGDTATEFDSGSGIDGDPYIIKTGAQLTYLASQVNLGNEYVNKYFKLQNSINLSGDSFQWTPIGADFTFAFKGHFNGGGFTVYNLNINSTANYQGLFGYIINGSISNLNVEGDVITTGTTAGGIVGHLGVNLGINPDAESIIKNCSFIGTVSALANAGGIVGDSDGGTSIFNCSVAETTVVSATGENIAKAGGIIGNNNSTVENCFSDVVIETSVYGGGIVGYNAGIINQCYSEGSISPQGTSFYVGGIAGYNITIAAKISNCYSGINIDVSTKNNGNAGGIAGRNLTSAVIVNSYFIGLIKNNEANAGLVGANSATIDFCYYDQSSFEGENFTDFGTSKSTAEMISEEFVDLIDASIDNSIWVFKAKDVVIDTSKVTYFYPQLACFAESGNQEIETASSNSVKTAELDAEKITLMDGATVFDTIYEAAGFPVTAPDNPAKTGYTFIEWNTSSDGTGDPYTFATMPENGLTLYAKLQAITYEVKYNGNGGEGSMDNSEHTYGEAKNLTANAYSKTGYTFKGWATSSGGEVVYTDSQSVKNLSATQDDEFELFAVWEAETYQITYKDVGGSDFSGDSTGLPLAHIYDAATTLVNPTKTGYDFKGWFINSNGTSDAITSLGATDYTDEIILYAKWEAQTYTITYKDVVDAAFSGQHGTDYPTTHTYDAITTLVNPTKTGYDFMGWFINSDGTGDAITSLGATDYTAAITLYAKWEAKIYTITYKDVGGSDFSGDSTGLPLTHTYDAATTLVNPTKTGYDFMGWFINSDGTGNAVTSLGATDYTAAITLYAKWEAQVYTITYKDVGEDVAFSGTHGEVYPQSHTYDAATTLVNPTKTGYDFMGWFINSDGTGDAITSLGATDYTAAITLYAKWKAQVYTITYKDIGEDVAFSGTHGEDYPQTHTYGASTALVNPTKTGYIFKGWFINSDGTGEKITGLLADGYTAAITLYAEWDIRDDYVVTLDYNYENGPQNETISGITYNTTINEPAEPSRTGYTFGGWYKEAGCETAWDFETDKVDADGIVLYAKWNPVIYQVKYNGNGSTSGSMDNSVHTYGASKALTANAFVKTGYAFAGWALTAAGVVVYADSAEVENLSEIQDDVFELFAIWEAVTYEVKYNGNGSTSGSMDNSGHIYDAAKNLTANVYERTGYIFKGWALSATGEVEYEDSESIINLSSVKDAEVELFAVWEAIMYQVKYNGNGADNELDNPMDNSGHTYDVGQALSENAFIKEGWTFMGWATSLNGEVVYQNRQIVVNLSSEQGYVVNLYAVWKIVVAFDSNGGTSVDSQEFETVDAKISMPDSPTRNGYTFSGWYTEKGTIGSDTGWGYEWDFDNDAINKAAGNMTLYAKWTANSQTLTYDAGTGNGAEVTESSYTDKGMKLPESVTFTKPGYEFTGWNTKEDGTGDNYAKGGDFTMPANNVTLYAQWRQFKVVFDGMDKQATINSDGKLENYIPKRFGFKFAGWYTDKGLMDAFDANSVITKDLTLYAKWTFDFNIVYIGGGALLAVILVVVILLIIKKKKSYTRLGSNLK